MHNYDPKKDPYHDPRLQPKFPRNRDELCEFAKSFVVRSSGVEANVILIPADMEACLKAWPSDEGFDLMRGLSENGRPPRMLGMRIVWDAPCFMMAYVPSKQPFDPDESAVMEKK